MRKLNSLLLISGSALVLASCGPDDIASPGAGSVVINNPTPAPGQTPGTPTPGAPITPAAGCPSIADAQGLSDQGTISGPTGTYRVCRLPSLIRTSSTLPKVAGVLYEMNGRVNVGCDGGFSAPTAGTPVTSTTIGCTTPLTADTNVTLTIAPGVILYASTGQSWLAVNRGNRISAVGNATQPIVFTSIQNVRGEATDETQGQWGGVVLMGRGITTDCNVGTTASGTCERDTEGAADLARFGGNDNAYSAGRMSFVQIRYSGFVLGQNRELQALTGESIGTGTILDHIQAHNSSDDGAEFFGGAPQMKYYIASGADDDSLDVDTGAQGDFQYVLLLQRAGRGDALMEIDSNGLETESPRTRYRIANFTALQPSSSADNEGSSGDLAATLFRGNSDNTLVNGIIATPNNECVRVNSSGAARATLTARSVVLQCNAAKYLATNSTGAGQAIALADIAAAFTGNNNSDAFTPTLASLFINGSNETAVSAFNPASLSSFFDATTWIGAVRNAQDNWYAGWTCNTGTFNLSGASSCTSLPTT